MFILNGIFSGLKYSLISDENAVFMCETDHVSVSFLTHQSTERNDGWDTGEEEEDSRRETLHVDTIPQHTGVHPRVVTVLYVVDHTAEKPEMLCNMRHTGDTISIMVLC